MSSWQPIEALHLTEYHGYAVSERVLLAIHFPESGQFSMKTGRVWEGDGKRSLPDNRHDTYDRVTHWMPLPAPPEVA